MVTCKDCLHCRACHEMYLVAVSQEDDFFERMDAETCEDFKDRYRYIEVPCKLGDTVYIIDGGQICEGIVIKIFSELDDETVYTIEFTDCSDYIAESDFVESDFGKTVFLTKKDAQKELLCRIARG